MTKAELQFFLSDVFRDAGLSRCPRCYRDIRYVLALIAGILVIVLVHDWVPVFSSSHEHQWTYVLAIILWQPFIEEVLFRGIIQGQLSLRKWGGKEIFKISAANIVTSVLFVGLHLVNYFHVWSLTIFIPSLLFGYFRDEFHSVYPSFFLHSAYNLMVVLGLLFHGHIIMNPFF